MSDPENPWNIPFSRTSFMIKVLSSHDNVVDLSRSKDIFFTFKRKAQGESMSLLAADEYTFSLALAMRALEDFGSLQFISVGGVWNGYSSQAKRFCVDRKIGLYNSSELSGGLWKDDYWDYYKKDEKGNRIDISK